MAVAVALPTQCVYCIEIHPKSALEAGATEAELTERIHVAAALRAGAAITHGSAPSGAQSGNQTGHISEYSTGSRSFEALEAQIAALKEEKIVGISEDFESGLDHADCQ